MSVKRISQFLAPQSIAVIGASNSPHRPGYIVMRNLLQGGFSGPIMPVSSKYHAVHGVLAYADIEQLPQAPSLAIVCSNKNTLADILSALAKKGCFNVIAIASGLDEEQKLALQAHAKSLDINLLGSNSLGMMLPHLGVNASFSHTVSKPGKVAFISQSAAVCSTILDWAKHKDIGFSYFLSVGDCLDIGFAELLNFLARDGRTKAILLYIDNLADIRGFISAARAAAFSKPVIVIKTGRTQAGAKAALAHTGGNVHSDDAIYDALIQRAGMLRVNDLVELFAATQTLAMHPKLLRSEPLAILTNGGGPAVMAVDSLLLRSGKLLQLSDDTLEQLRKILPHGNYVDNPIDIFGDSEPERCKKALQILLQAPEVENLLIIHTPTALAPSTDYAKIIVDTVKQNKGKTPFILTNFMGEEAAYEARKICMQASIPTYRTPEGAVNAYMHLINYRRNQKHLTQTPESIVDELNINAQGASELISQHLSAKEHYLSSHQSAPILAHYGIKTVRTEVATTPSEAAEVAQEVGFPVALKLLSPDISSKSAVGGVVLNLNDAHEVEQAAFSILLRVNKVHSDARIDGFAIQPMAERSDAWELRVAIKSDPQFGPVILLGEAGTALDYSHAAVALPPLNMNLAKYFIASAIDKGFIKERMLASKADKYHLCALLTRISQLIIDQPDIHTLELNPLLAMGERFLVLDAIMQVEPYQRIAGKKRLPIRPYPKEFEQALTLKDGSQVLIRPIRPEDEQAHSDFDRSLSKEDRYNRFFGQLPQFNHDQLAKMTQIDYDREMAFIATVEQDGRSKTLGVARVLMDPDNISGEFAVVIRSDSQGLGLGSILMKAIIHYCQEQGVGAIEGVTLWENAGMIALAKRLGFEITRDFADSSVHMYLNLNKTNND